MNTNIRISEENIVLINNIIRDRRSFFPKEYTGEVIPDEVVKQMLENANWAPTHGRTEPWRFFVFAGDGRKTFADFQSNMYKELTPAENFDEAKFKKMSEMPLLASHVIGVAMQRQPSEQIPEVEEIEAVACAVQNMYLTVTAYGYGGYWSSGGVTYKKEAKSYFGLGDKDHLLGFFYVGVPKEGIKKEGLRKPIEDKVTWINE